MTASELLTALRDKGIRLEARGNKLRYYPASAVEPELREVLAAHKTEVLALLKASDEEIAWRIKAMLPQIPDTGPIPLLIARAGIETRRGQCVSCGNLLQPSDGFVCTLCGRAKNLALEMAMSKATPTDEKSE